MSTQTNMVFILLWEAKSIVLTNGITRLASWKAGYSLFGMWVGRGQSIQLSSTVNGSSWISVSSCWAVIHGGRAHVFSIVSSLSTSAYLSLSWNHFGNPVPAFCSSSWELLQSQFQKFLLVLSPGGSMTLLHVVLRLRLLLFYCIWVKISLPATPDLGFCTFFVPPSNRKTIFLSLLLLQLRPHSWRRVMDRKWFPVMSL